MERDEYSAYLSKEWIETNGLGGWASSTVSGMHTRGYHGLLVAAVNPPTQRKVLLSRMDETVIVNNTRHELATRHYPKITTPQGYRYLHSFKRDLFPEFEYKVDELIIKKTIAAIHGKNTVIVKYELKNTSDAVTLELQPFAAGRDYHSLGKVRAINYDQISFENNILTIPEFEDSSKFKIQIPGAKFFTNNDWYYQFEYLEELARGLNCLEDLFTPGKFEVKLNPNEPLFVIISSESQAVDSTDSADLFETEKQRRLSLIDAVPVKDPVVTKLVLAADQFIVQRGTEQKTIIAGYHWFTDWGRDTMIALPGICLTTRRFDDAKKILKEFSQHVNQGMLPNRFPDKDTGPEYNSVDAALWYFIAVYKYFEYTNDTQFIKDEILPVLRDIIAWHIKGTRFGIKVDEDGLLLSGEPEVQLTWMDAKIGKWVVTPRTGKTVEVNALWYNCLKILEFFEDKLGSKEASKKLTQRAEIISLAFNQIFWNEKDSCLLDYVSIADDQNQRQIRPNQIIALSLPFPILSIDRGEKILACIEKELLTIKGLRTLSPFNKDYRGRYEGDNLSRDSAYHQGTVWPWLLGQFFTALINYRQEKGRSQAQQIFNLFISHLDEAGIGTISEIFDGDTPQYARGCIAQAWSVGEILRSYVENILGEDYGNKTL